MLLFISILVNPRCKHDIFTVFIILKSTCFHDETVDGMHNVIDIMSLLYGVALLFASNLYQTYILFA
jgi:hypothetical protein